MCWAALASLIYDYELGQETTQLSLVFILGCDRTQLGLKRIDEVYALGDIFLEEYVPFSQTDKSRQQCFDEEDYSMLLPFDVKKGFSAEFQIYFAGFL